MQPAATHARRPHDGDEVTPFVTWGKSGDCPSDNHKSQKLEKAAVHNTRCRRPEISEDEYQQRFCNCAIPGRSCAKTGYLSRPCRSKVFLGFVLAATLRFVDAAPYSFGIVSDSACNGLTTWQSGDCKIFAGQDLPSITVGLFDSDGNACCGEAQVSVQAMVSKGGAAVSTTGYLDRDSAIADSMQVEFSGIRLQGTEAGSGFAITFSTFYNGYFLTYTSPLFLIAPNSIELEAPWGTFGDFVAFEDEGPWQVHEVLPTFTVTLTVLNTTATSIVASDNFYIGARLFDKNSLADISATSLTGVTRKLVEGGKASFDGLSVGLVAGTGFRMSFFLEGSDRPCLPSILRAVCDEWEAQRGLTGGLGGYETETMSDDISIYPDSLTLGISGRHPGILRVDETMFTYEIKFFDSSNPGVAIDGFVASDDFSVSASLFNGDGTDITSWGLTGTTTVAPNGDAATFDSLIVQNTAGAAFVLQFSTSWNARCVAKLVDTACSGKCCIRTVEFFVFPYSIQLNPSSLSTITEGSTLPDITVSFRDYAGNVLSGISTGDGFQITPYLRKRGSIIAFEGEQTIVVDAGVAVFSGLRIVEEAGSLFTLLFQEDNSQMSAVTSLFNVYGSSLLLDSASQATIDAGEDLQGIVVRVRGSANQTLVSIEAADAFDVTLHALKWDGSSFVDCGCIQGTSSVLVDGGVASVAGSEMTIRATIGLFKLEMRLDRVGMSTLAVQTETFGVLPASLALTEYGFQSAYANGETLADIDVSFAAVDGSFVPDVNTADGVSISATLLYFGEVVANSGAFLTGGTSQTVDAGVATFSGLQVDGVAGSGYQVMFTFVDAVDGTVLTANSTEFALRPNKLAVNNSRPDAVTNELLPAMSVSLTNDAGGRLTDIAVADSFVVSVSLVAGAQLGCFPADFARSVLLETAGLNASECRARALEVGSSAFMTGFDSAPTAAYLQKLDALSASVADLNGDSWRVQNVTGGCGDVEVRDGSVWRRLCAASFTASESATLCSFFGLGASAYAGQARSYNGSDGFDLSCSGSVYADPSSCGGSVGACGGSGSVARLCCAGLEEDKMPLCAVDFTGDDPEAECASGQPCWLVDAVQGWSNASSCGSEGICCGAECECSPVETGFSTRSAVVAYGLVNRTSKLLGTKAVLVSAGIAEFVDLRVADMFGKETFWLRYSDNGDALARNTTTEAFSVGPPRLVVRGATLSSVLVSQSFDGINVSLTDLNARALTPMPRESGPPFALQPYTIAASATHAPSASFSETIPLAGGATRVVEGSSVDFTGIKLDGQAGSGFSLSFTLQRAVGPVTVTTRNFTVFPDVLALPSGPVVLSNLSDAPMPAVTLECQTATGALLSGIREDDSLVVRVEVLDRNGSVLGACASISDTSCVSGTTEVTVSNGTAVFRNVVIQGTAGTGFRYRWTMLGGGPSLESPTFSVFPGEMVISEGIDDFFGQYWVVNRGVGDYAVRLQTPTTGAPSTGVVASDEFNISATLTDTQTGTDITASALQGQKWMIASYDAARGAHAVFTDLVVVYAGSGLQLKFEFADVSSALEASTTKFRAVPYALRITQSCYNGNALNITGPVPYGVPQLACVGTDDDAPSDFGQFGFLTGYYYYVDNGFIGPMLKTVRGFARVPTIEVTATDLFGTQLTDITAADGLVIQADLYKDAVAFSSELGGSTQVTLDGGAASFADLTVGNVTDCAPSCDLLLRFSLVGALCSDTWCTNVSVSLEEAEITAPQNLGSHPAFPGTQSISGVAVIPLANALSAAEQSVFASAIVAFAGVSALAPSDVTITGAANATARRLLAATTDLEVAFSIAARTFAQASAIYAGVTTFLDSGTAVFNQVCTFGERASLELCNKTVTLKEPLSREVVSLLLSSRVPTPTFLPLGSSSTCVGGGSCVEANFSAPFSEFSVTITTTSGSTVYFTMDTCPTPTTYCTSTGSVLSTDSLNTSSGTPIQVISASPTSTILPVGLAVENPVVADGAAFGARGQRYVAEMPAAITVKAYGTQNGKKAGFQGSATYALPAQAVTPTISLKKKYVLGWCNESTVSTTGGGAPYLVSGACSSLHSNGSECNAAQAVPCTSYGFVCSSGSLGYTIASNGVYDGTFGPGGSTVLTDDYGAGQSSLFVSSLAALGFVNDGVLPTARSIQVGVNSPLTVTAVDQATSSLTINVDLGSSFAAAGSAVSLLDACSVGTATRSVTVELASGTSSAQLYYSVDASTPTASSFVLANPGTLSFALPANLTVVAAGAGVISSFPLEVDFEPPCGDGTTEGGEQCDDGNRQDGDGCSADCYLE